MRDVAHLKASDANPDKMLQAGCRRQLRRMEFRLIIAGE